MWNGDKREVHLVCWREIPIEDVSGDKTAGIELEISNYLVISYENRSAELYPGNVLKEDICEEYQTDGVGRVRLVTSVTSAKTRTGARKTGVHLGTRSCTAGNSTDLRTCLNARPKNTISLLIV
jgi:hypothetical protein